MKYATARSASNVITLRSRAEEPGPLVLAAQLAAILMLVVMIVVGVGLLTEALTDFVTQPGVLQTFFFYLL